MAFTKQRRPAPGMNAIYGNNALLRNPAPVQPAAYPPAQQAPQQNQRNTASSQGSPNPHTGNQAPAPQNTRQQPQERHHRNSGNPAPQEYRQASGGQARPPENRKATQNQSKNAPEASAPSAVPETDDSSYLSCKIWKVNGNKKVVDFTLIQADVKDYANVHGIGGSKHAPNSTIGIAICDYTNGTGEGNSFTVRYNVDVEDMETLYNAAMMARLGFLNILPPLNNGQQSNYRFAYTKQKNNPYPNAQKVFNGVACAPVSQLSILFDPSRNYPWIIQISNCYAPLIVQQNGASTHDLNHAVNVVKSSISVSADDFCASMVAVKRFVRLWEQRMYRVIDAQCRKYEAYREEKNKANYAK